MPSACLLRYHATHKQTILESQRRRLNVALQVRRVVTGHKADGKATILIDELSTNVVSSRPGTSACVIWTTEGFPVSNDGDTDTEKGASATTLDPPASGRGCQGSAARR